MENLVSALEQLEPFLDQLSAGVQFVDASFRYRYLNRAAAAHGKRPREELLGRTMEDCYPGISGTELFTRLRTTLETGTPDALENAFTFPDGSQGWFEVQMYRAGGGVAITSVDITRRKRLEVHLTHAQRMEASAQLAGGVAHEFNNLLLIIRSFAELVREDERLSLDGKQDLAEVLKAVDRAAVLTQTLLAFARHPGRSPIRLDVNQHLEKFCGTLSAALGEGIRLTTDLAPDVGIIKIDPHAWEHALTSLAMNAHEAMHGRGPIVIRGRRVLIGAEQPLDAKRQRLPPGDYVCVSLIDGGPGIEPEDMEKIFDPFFSTKKEGGTGLGLATCWGIIERAQGTIQVQSTPGRGAQFDIFLPRKTSLASDSIAPPRSFSPPHPQQSLKILVADDEPAILRAVEGLLRKAGHRVDVARSAPEALSRLAEGGFDLVISDILMPEMSGVELALELEQRAIETPVLLMSGYATNHESLRSAQRFPLITKPFSLAELLRAIDKLLPRARDEG